MLEQLKKALNKPVEQNIQMINDMEKMQAEFASEKENLIASFNSEKTSLIQQVEQLTTKLQSLENEIAQFSAEKEAKLKLEAEEKQNARKLVLSKIVGDEKADAMMASFANVDDVVFNSIVDGVKVVMEAEEKKFSEVGLSSDKDIPSISLEAKILQQKFNQ